MGRDLSRDLLPTRRGVLRATGIMAVAGLTRDVLRVPAALAQAAAPDADVSVEKWMTDWMTSARRMARGALHVARFADPVYVLTKPIDWLPNQGQKAGPVHVPTGFVTDFASVPRVFWTALRPDGVYTYPAIIHDYLYWEQSRTREEADQVFRWSMEDFKIPAATIEVIYRAVRWGGESYWEQNRRLKAGGERRVLRELPDDPLVRWEDWKKRPSVFADI